MNDGKITFSIIIPVYKVEKYLKKCIDSILEQTYKNFELILVDDGSPDSCPEICDEYAALDKRVITIHKANGGLSSARNAGIDCSSGDYVLFVDSDDYWDSKEALRNLADTLSETYPDVLCFGCKKISESNLKAERYFDSLIESCFDKKVFENERFISSAWSKAVKRSLFNDGKLRFTEGVTSEDIEWSLKLAIDAKTIAYVDLDFYCYLQRSDSISHAFSEKKFLNLRDNVLSCIDILEKQSMEKQLELRPYVSYQYAVLIFNIALIPDKTLRKKYISDVSDKKKYLDYSNSGKVKIMKKLEKVIGLANMCSLIRFYQKCREKA